MYKGLLFSSLVVGLLILAGYIRIVSKNNASFLQGHLELPASISYTVLSADATRATLGFADSRLKISRLPQSSDLKQLAQLQRLNMDSLYHPSLAPYPGYVSRAVACDPALRPRPETANGREMQFDGFQAFANSRYVLGACTRSEAQFTVHSGLLRCSRIPEVLFEIQFFEGVGKNRHPFADFLQNAKCM